MRRHKKATCKPLREITDAEVEAYLTHQNETLARPAVPEPQSETGSRSLRGMSDEAVIEAANRDRADDLGTYGMTAAMREEQRRMAVSDEPSRGVRDDWA